MRRLFVSLALVGALAVPASASAHRVSPTAARSIAVSWVWNHDCPNLTAWSCAPDLGGGVFAVSSTPVGDHSWNVKAEAFQRHIFPPFEYRGRCRNVLVTHYDVAAVSHSYGC